MAKEAIVQLLKMAMDVFKKEDNLVKIKDPVVFVGDIHGQFFDMCKMMDLVGRIGELNYVFLGDYVDRGMFALEVVLVLYALKINYPNNVLLLRGNHECRQMSENFNFRTEILSKYDESIHQMF